MTEPPSPARSVAEVVGALDPAGAEDAAVLMDLMHRISGAEPEVWNVATIGYDRYHYRYDSGREGDGHALGFYPRRGKLTIYLMDGTSRHTEDLARLGRHTTSRVCIYAKRVADLDLAVLESVLRDSYAYLKEHDGDMHRA